MNRSIGKMLAGAATLGLILQGPVARASSCNLVREVLAVDPDYWKKPCRNALRNRTKFLGKITRGALGEDEAWDYAMAFATGESGCTENDDFAFEIASAAVGWPLAKNIQPWKIDFLDYHVPEYLDDERKRMISWFNWIGNPSRYGGLPRGWTEEEARQQILLEDHWERARARFGSFLANPLQDQMLFDALSDPESERFDLDEALAMVSILGDVSVERKTRIAELLVDPTIGHLDYDGAAQLVAWYSPFSQSEAEPESISKVKLIWRRIAQNMLDNVDPEIHKKGQAILATGDPYQEEPMALNETQLPQIPDLILLKKWPDGLALTRAENFNRLVTANDYPSIAIRQEQEGAVGLAALFGPDGKFSDLVILNPSGVERLDEAARRTVLRRLQPDFKALILKGFSSNNVLAPLPVIEWKLSRVGEPQPGSKIYRNGRIIVTYQMGEMSVALDTSYGCPIWPSWKN